ncbi:MAG: TetR family transcriptional regulator [Ideonella sp.]
MARRTKQDAQATRDHLLDTAERVFLERGVSRTSLHDLAAAAGVTRGAIYWHFHDKADLFNAMMNRVSLPMEEALERSAEPSVDALAQLRASLVGVLEKLVADPQVHRVFEIAMHKVEYVDEMSEVRKRHLSVRNDCMASVTRALGTAMDQGQIARRMLPADAAIGLHALIDGLIQNWILDPLAFDLRQVGEQVLDAYLRGMAPLPSVLGTELASSSCSRQCSRTP